MRYIRYFEEIGIEDIGSVGGKNASLGEMYGKLSTKGINVPNGFATTSEAYWMFLEENGIKNAIEQTKKYLKNKKIYVTLDMDVLDPVYAPGTSTPEPFGISSFDVLECIKTFSPQLVGFDVVEVCPPYDNGETSLLAAKIMRFLLEYVWLSKPVVPNVKK